MADGTLGNMLYKERIKREMNLSQVAHQLGVAVSNYRSWEQGSHYPGVSRLADVALWLQVPIPTLLRAAGIISPAKERALIRLNRTAKL